MKNIGITCLVVSIDHAFNVGYGQHFVYLNLRKTFLPQVVFGYLPYFFDSDNPKFSFQSYFV